jgi:hypothetical protein
VVPAAAFQYQMKAFRMESTAMPAGMLQDPQL